MEISKQDRSRVMGRFCAYIQGKLDYTFVENDTRERMATGNFNANSTEEKEWGGSGKG